MKKLIIGLCLVTSTAAMAGKIDVKIGQISDQKVSIDKSIEIDSMTLKLNCHWKTTFFQDLGDETNNFETESINVSLTKSGAGYTITTTNDLLLSKFKFKSNKYCLARFDMSIHSDSLAVYADSYMTQVKLGTKGNLTSELKAILSNSTFSADTFINQRGEKVLSRVILK